ncbi:hypothetical protein JYT44_03650, partial [Caldithrix abyssi]|nr:hypothetical protein [Caldithrix abyssi]
MIKKILVFLLLGKSFAVSQLFVLPEMSWNFNIEYSRGQNYRFDNSIENYTNIEGIISFGIMNYNPSHFGWMQVDFYRGTNSKYLPLNILLFGGTKNTGDIFFPISISSFLFLGPNYAFTRGVGYYLSKEFLIFQKDTSQLNISIHSSLAPFVDNREDYAYGIVLFPRLVYSYGKINLSANILSSMFQGISDGKMYYRIYPTMRLG